MNKVYKHTRIVITLVLLVLAFLCVYDATYAYFTATAKADGTGKFASLRVQFVYRDAATQSINDTYSNTTLELYPVPEIINRNEAFKFSLTSNTNTPIKSLSIRNAEESVSCYVRFWIDAYLLDDNGDVITTKNYGKYFLFKEDAENRTYTNQDSSSSTKWYYYVTTAMAPNDGVTIDLGDELTLSDLSNDPVPLEILGEKMQLTISLEAVQSAHGAFLTEFADGYYTNSIYWK